MPADRRTRTMSVHRRLDRGFKKSREEEEEERKPECARAALIYVGAPYIYILKEREREQARFMYIRGAERAFRSREPRLFSFSSSFFDEQREEEVCLFVEGASWINISLDAPRALSFFDAESRNRWKKLRARERVFAAWWRCCPEE